MKPGPLILLGCVSLASPVTAEEQVRASGLGPDKIPKDSGAPSAEVTTDDAFIARRAKAAMNMPPPLRQPPRASAFGLMEMSTAIQGGADFMLVPKGSVLFCPPALAVKIVERPTGKMMDWAQFVGANRSWITTFAVTREQVTGEKPIPPDAMERFQKNKLLVLATLQGGPVTVLKPKQP